MSEKKYPSALEGKILLLNLLLSLLGVVIGMELITRLGITTNTSIIGALVAILIARIPVGFFKKFLDIHRQNLVQTAVSASTFVAGNAILVPVGIPWLLGRMDLMLPMFIGASAGTLISITTIYWLFDSRVFPAKNLWPPGIATAETILAAAEKGRRAMYLVYGGIAGGLLNGLFSIPADVLGISWIGNMWALAMFGIGLLIRGYLPGLTGIDLNLYYFPSGIMVGAGIVALVQVAAVLSGKKSSKLSPSQLGHSQLGQEVNIKSGLGKSLGIYTASAALIALLGNLYWEMSPGMMILWIFVAAGSALVCPLLVGLSAMHAGWFPAFAIALIVLVVGMLLGFPPSALALLVGFAASVGPAFADMGYDLKAGWILRGEGKNMEFEYRGRREQYLAELTGAAVAILLVALVYRHYFIQDLIPPVDRVFAATIQAGTNPEIAKYLLIWAVPGAILQAIGGPARQLGILFATGLLICHPLAGFTVLAGIGIRLAVLHKYGKDGQDRLYILGAGLIAGSALVGFVSSTLRLGGGRGS
jgi:uncharacterized oligopeptide transporter (OPT) family protein